MSTPPDRVTSGEQRRALPPSTEARRLLVPRLLVLTLAGLALFGYPLLAQFEAPARYAGVPALYLYLFGVWALLVGALAWLMESGPARRRRRHR